MNPWMVLGLVWCGAALLMAGVWVYCHRKQDATLVDIAWALGIGVAGIAAAALLEGDAIRRWAVAILALLWSVRLGGHMLQRAIGKDEEDGRYQTMRQWLGDKQAVGFFVFFQMQAVFIVLFTAPMVAAMAFDGPLGWRDGLGLLIWAGAMVGEVVADRQLAAFKRDPQSSDASTSGGVCKRGLWRYSRHPNYFFEWLHWFAYLAIGATFATSIGWAALLGPAVMLVFLLFVTGIPYTEKRAIQSKGEAYRQYQRETSAFIPWFASVESS